MIPNTLLSFVGLLAGLLPVVQAAPNHWSPHKDKDDCFVSFNDFLEQVKGATFDQYNHTAVESCDAFDEMRNHILTMYDGVGDITKSFVLDVEYGDCIDVKKQPSIRLLGLDTIECDPRNMTDVPELCGEGGGEGKFHSVDSPLKLGLTDRFGNSISCHVDTIPFARITLEKLTRFATLADFFSKSSDGAQAMSTPADGGDGSDGQDSVTKRHLERRDAIPHLYAYTYQYVTNFGGNSWLNLWNPVGDFSLSQQWYAAGSGNGTQTVEGGWVVYPNKFNTNNAVLFIFFTPDNYKSGCWNLDCPGFVQINHNWFLGGIWNHYSTAGGAQWGFEMQWKLYNGNWWLFLKGPGDYEAVGYYPTKLYNGGPLAYNATVVEYGGEVTRFSDANKWPQMGSSVLPTGGYGQSAFQNSIFYIPRDENGGTGVWTDLTGVVVGTPSCWSIDVTESPYGGSWGTYFWFGGPGGMVCN